MDLSMSEDFDSSLLNWDEDGQQEGTNSGSGPGPGSQTPLSGEQRHEPQPLTTQARKEGFSRLPSFPTSIGGVYYANGESQQNGIDANGIAAAANLTNPYAMQMLYPLTRQTIASTTAAQMNSSTGMQQQQQQNPMVQYALTGQSTGAPFPSFSFSNTKNQMDTVSCLSTTTGGNTSSAAAMKQAPTAAATQPTKLATAAPTPLAAANPIAQPMQQPNQVNGALPTTQLHPLGIQSSAGCPPMSSTPVPSSAAPNAAMQFNPYMFNPYAMMAAGNPQLFAAYQQANQQQLAAQYAAAQANASQSNAAPAAAPTKPPAATLPPPAPVAKARPKKANAAPAKKAKKTVKKKKDETPPFLLFDAPCELRQNFMATQRMLNLPVHQDGNSFHYGMAVNGFHPQLNVATDPLPVSSSHLPPGVNVKLLDSRHKERKGAGKERNEREQKRAQKITELIEQIRTSMEDGGWKVEMKSKHHTLTMCADYVKHLIKSTEEKEEAVEKAKSDLEVKERKLEEDKAFLEGRSDPESVTSSLTASSGDSGVRNGAASGNVKPVFDDTSSERKRKAEEMEASGSKKAKAEESSADMSAADDGGRESSGPSGHNIHIGKMSSSVSELTDSNRGSSDSGGEKAGRNGNAAHKKHPRAEEEDERSDLLMPSSISSTAAVLRGTGSHNRDHGHADVVVREKKHSRRRKRFRSERSSLDRKFVIDYEEVFLTSNVPQIIATPAGRIVAWNKFFLKATSLDETSVQRLTIFSLVQQDKLANLFEMVAEALRQKPTSSESSSGASSSGKTTEASAPSSSENTDAEQQTEEYATMTLPCTSVLSASTASDSSGATAKPNPLHMTVTLMPDEDAHKRCFHCVFTDCKGTDGKMGFITPELLAELFEEPQTASTKLARARKPVATKSNEESEGIKIEVNSAVVDNGDGGCD